MKKLIMSLTFLVLLSCNTFYGTINLQPYSLRQYSNLKLLIAPLPDDIQVNYSGNLKEEFGEGHESILIPNHFLSALKNNIPKKSAFSEVKVCYNNLESFNKAVSLPIPNDDSTSFNFPDKTISFKGYIPDFILFFKDTFLGTKTESVYITSGLNGAGHNISTKYLIYESKFAYWDNKDQQVAAYGRAIYREQNNIVTIGDWHTNDTVFVRRILEETPFYND